MDPLRDLLGATSGSLAPLFSNEDSGGIGGHTQTESLLGAQVHSSPWNHSGGGASRVVINTV